MKNKFITSKEFYQSLLSTFIDNFGYWSEEVFNLNNICLSEQPKMYHKWHNEVKEEFRINKRIYNN